MRIVWIYSDIKGVAVQLVSAAVALRPDAIYAACTDEDSSQMLAQSGVTKVFYFKSNRPESCVEALAATIMEQGATAVLFGATARGREIAALVAARLETPMASEVTSVKMYAEGLEIERYIYGGMAVSTLQLPGLACVSIAPGSYPAAEATASLVEILCVEAPADSRITVTACAPVQHEGVDLGTASKVVCIGRALEKQEDLGIIAELAQTLGAEMACSRGVAEDYKWMPLDRYVGISGVKINADLHVSVGISGQVQHIAGIRDAKCVVAVDSNENAPIFAAADYGIVGNLYEVVPLLTKALQ